MGYSFYYAEPTYFTIKFHEIQLYFTDRHKYSQIKKVHRNDSHDI